ncbi:MAG TPA: hypothetical protein VFI29_08845 [Hanamia sp.]|nr:hypothetical protein [Hanamia sp.]
MKYFLTIFTLFTFSSVFSQDMHKDSSANYVANWIKGENKIFYIIHNKESYESGKLKSEFNFSYEAYVTILDSTKNNYTIQWTFHLPDKVKETNPRLADSLPVFEGMKMIFKTSETGEFKELINWQVVRDSYIKMMEISLPKKMDSTAKAALEQDKALFNSKEMVESALIKEIQLFYLPYGETFTTNEIKAKTQLPTPFGSEPVPALETYKITEINPKQNYFMLVINQDIDKSGAQKFFEGLFSKATMDSDKAVLESKKFLETFEIKDHSEYKFIPSTGWPKRISYERTLKNEQITQTDSYIIEMKE